MRGLRDSILRAVSLVVTDRRWAAPLSAMALGFGLFLGVAIGPGAAGGLATGSGQIIAIAEQPSEPASEAGGGEAEAAPEPEAFGGAPESEPAPEYAPEPLLAEPAPEAPEPAPAPEPEPAPEEESEAQLLEGTVVHANPAAGSYAVALAGGELVSVHAAKLPPLGAELSLEAEQLANGTFGETRRRRSGSATKASFAGVVTHVDSDPAAPAYTVSGRGSSIPVHVPTTTADDLPALGAYVTVVAGFEKLAGEEATEVEGEAAEPALGETPAGEASTCAVDPGLDMPPRPAVVLVQRRRQAEPDPATYVDLAGVLSAVCPASGQVLLSADDIRAGGADLALALPKRFNAAKLRPGDSFLATAELAADGTLTLAGLASDEGLAGARDASSAQGDLKR